MTPEWAESLRDAVAHAWGQAQLIGVYAPGRVDDLEFKEWCVRGERMSASPQAMLNLIDTITRADVRGVLPTGQTPTLVLHRPGDRLVSLSVRKSWRTRLRALAWSNCQVTRRST
jgi:hypothetical protein